MTAQSAFQSLDFLTFPRHFAFLPLYIVWLLPLPHKSQRALEVTLAVIKAADTAFNGLRLWLQCLVKLTASWYFDNCFKYFYCLTFVPQYSLSLAPKKPREAKVWAEIAEYMSIQDQTIVDERELLEEHQFLLELRPVRPLLIVISIP